MQNAECRMMNQETGGLPSSFIILHSSFCISSVDRLDVLGRGQVAAADFDVGGRGAEDEPPAVRRLLLGHVDGRVPPQRGGGDPPAVVQRELKVAADAG